eukprot:1280089-Pyramimonas_sp.AAC.1
MLRSRSRSVRRPSRARNEQRRQRSVIDITHREVGMFVKQSERRQCIGCKNIQCRVFLSPDGREGVARLLAIAFGARYAGRRRPPNSKSGRPL